MEDGGQDYAALVTERTRHILATHRSEPLPKAVGGKLDEITSQAERALADKQFGT